MDIFNLMTDSHFRDIPQCLLKLVDDMLIQAETKDECLQRFRIVLKKCEDAGIKLLLGKLEM
ncbi:hypothetical protein TCAL_17356 [Tigriopus californicus]|uniref:Reverse transcriptase domain-containing protein n=1 Tax=Tigriopus californicus TaxID=6832 RepID=A0A553NGI8_TIGCA|nr:hypothetical protein TCAL_17356 [Tigriopus californicus]